jgi:catenin beta 1
MDYPTSNHPPPPSSMHHQIPSHSMHHPQHPLLSNQLQPINPETHTSMWLDDPYAVSNASASQRDSGFNSRPASLRSIDSTVTNTTGPLHHGQPIPTGYEQIPPTPSLPPDHENMHPQYVEMQSAPVPPSRPDPNQVIPELLNLLMEDDPVIVHEAVGLIHMLVKEGGEGRSEAIRHRELIHTLFESFSKDAGDGKIIHALASLFHALSQQQEGLRAMLDCGGIPRLIQILDSPDQTVNFVITTLHNFLIVLQEQSAHEIDRCNGTQNFINLLHNNNEKLLTLVSDCLLKMSIYNLHAKSYIQSNEECVQCLLRIFDTTKYDKLLLTISKLFPIISSGNEIIKRVFLQLNALSIFEKQIRLTRSIRIRHNCLIALRNISDQATRMRDVDSLVQQLTGILLTDDQQSVLCSLGILSNLTADNRTNKSLLVKLNGVQTLMHKLMMNADKNDDSIEAALCTLRHVTARHDLENEAREAIKKSYGIGNIVKLLRDKNFKEHWGTIKATVGLIKNLALSSTIIPQLSEQNAVRILTELLKNVDQERTKVSMETKQYLSQFDHMIEIIIGALNNLAKDSLCKSMIKEMDSISVVIRCSYLPSCSLQQIANSLLKELNIDRDRVQLNDQQFNNYMIDSRHNRQQ